MPVALIRAVFVAAFLVGVGVFVTSDAVSAAKEFMVQGTVDCGRKSGQRCEIGDVLTVWTADVTGERQKATIDVSWIKRQLDRYDQDDLICIDVRVMPDGKLQGLAISATCGAPDPKRRIVEDDDAKPAQATPGPTIDLELTKSGRVGFCETQSCIVWEITVTNVSPAIGTGVKVVDRPEIAITIDSASPSQGTYDPVSNVWNIGTLNPGQSVTLILEVFPFGEFTNCAEVQTADQTDADSTPNNDDLNEDDQDCVLVGIV